MRSSARSIRFRRRRLDANRGVGKQRSRTGPPGVGRGPRRGSRQPDPEAYQSAFAVGPTIGARQSRRRHPPRRRRRATPASAIVVIRPPGVRMLRRFVGSSLASRSRPPEPPPRVKMAGGEAMPTPSHNGRKRPLASADMPRETLERTAKVTSLLCVEVVPDRLE